MKKFFSMILVSLMVLTATAAFAKEAFIIGVAPHTSARVILEMYQPLRVYMEKALGMPVEIVTATDFDTFLKRATAQEFDIAVTTGQQARLLQVDSKYAPLLTYKAEFKALALVSANGSIKKPADLKGKQVLGLSPTSQVTLWGVHWLKNNKVTNAKLKYVSASDSVAQLIISGEVAAGFTSLANYQKLSPEVRGQLKIFAESKPMAGRVYMLNSRNSGMLKKIDAALWEFSETDEAKKYFDANKLAGYRKLGSTELKEMDPYANEVRKIMKNAPK